VAVPGFGLDSRGAATLISGFGMCLDPGLS
jgi:hypothetical protein